MIALWRATRRTSSPLSSAVSSYPRARWKARRRRALASRHSAEVRQALSACASTLVGAPMDPTMGHLPRTESLEGMAEGEGLPPILPIAIARPHEAAGYRSAVMGSIDRWAHQRWQFIAPRLIPAALAFVGMLGVLAAMDLMASRCRLDLGPPTSSATIYLVGDTAASTTTTTNL